MSYRSKTYGRPLRLYESELKEASELYQRAISKRRGRVVFIAGQPKSGRTDLLASIGHSLSKEYHRPHLLAGQFLEDRYIPKTVDFSSTIGAAVGETLSFIAKLVGPVPSAVADFVGQLLQAGAALKAMKDEINSIPPDLPEELKALIRSVSAEKPVVYLVDDLDESQDSWLADLLQEMATEIDRDLPLLVFVTVEGPAKLGEHKESDSRLMTTARSLIKRGVADWWHLTPLSRDEVGDYIGNARPGMAAHLHQVTGGYPQRVIQLWQDWQVRDVVRYSDEEDCWYLNQEKRPSLNLVKDVIYDRLRNIFGRDDEESINSAVRLLAYGALEGDCFTAEAVAQALNQEPDDLINFIDDYLLRSDDNPDGILSEAGHLELSDEAGNKRILWRYRFSTDLFWFACQEYGLTKEELVRASATLIRALRDAYTPEIRLVAGLLARLCRTCGDESAAAHFQKMWDYGSERETMRQKALHLLKINKDEWNYWQLMLALQLLQQAGELMTGSYPVEETILVLEEAYLLAVRTNNRSQQAIVGCYCGTEWLRAGNPDLAKGWLEDALAIFREIGERHGEATCLRVLAEVARIISDHEIASERYEQALTIFREICNRDGEASCLRGLAQVAFAIGDYEMTRKQVEKALPLFREICSRDGEATCLLELAAVAMTTGNYETASEQCEQALLIFREIGRSDGEASCLLQMAKVVYVIGNCETAREQAEQAQTIFRELGSRHGEANCLFVLAKMALLASDYGTAREQCEQALSIYRVIGESLKEIISCQRLMEEIEKVRRVKTFDSAG